MRKRDKIRYKKICDFVSKYKGKRHLAFLGYAYRFDAPDVKRAPFNRFGIETCIRNGYIAIDENDNLYVTDKVKKLDEKSHFEKSIEYARTEGRNEGFKLGVNEQRNKYESIRYPKRGEYTWLEGPPKHDRVTVEIPSGYYDAFIMKPDDMNYRFMDHKQRMEFKLKIKGVALANGVMIRWADWEPYGPYVVTDFSMPPGYR